MRTPLFWLNKKNGRYYKILIYKDMLNDTILTCVWGSIHSKLGNYSHFVMNTAEETHNFIENINKKRYKNGYELVKG